MDRTLRPRLSGDAAGRGRRRGGPGAALETGDAAEVTGVGAVVPRAGRPRRFEFLRRGDGPSEQDDTAETRQRTVPGGLGKRDDPGGTVLPPGVHAPPGAASTDPVSAAPIRHTAWPPRAERIVIAVDIVGPVENRVRSGGSRPILLPPSRASGRVGVRSATRRAVAPRNRASRRWGGPRAARSSRRSSHRTRLRTDVGSVTDLSPVGLRDRDRSVSEREVRSQSSPPLTTRFSSVPIPSTVRATVSPSSTNRPVSSPQPPPTVPEPSTSPG